jgi:hypothetical protein
MLLCFVQGKPAEGANIHKTVWPEYTDAGYRRAPEMVEASEPLTDALVYEPVPYRSALRENCTHVVVLRTRGDGVRVTEKMSLLERVMLSRYFGRKQNLPELVDWMTNQVRHARMRCVLNNALLWHLPEIRYLALCARV